MRGFEDQEEVRLVLAAQTGDLSAFDRLVKHYRPALISLARQLVGKELAQDVAQDALLTAYKALPQLQQPERFGGWVAAIARHRTTRLGQRKDEQTLRLDEVLAAHLPSIDAVYDGLDREIECAMAELPDEIQAVAKLYYLQEWSTKEIGEFLEIPITTVKWRLHTARGMLRSRLDYLEKEENHE